MDRREALTRMAAAGAVATGGSFVLSSNGVAFAASIGETGLVEGSIPPAGAPLPISFDPRPAGNNSGKELALGDATAAACTSGAPATALYGWRINDFDLRGGPRRSTLEIRNSGGRVIADSVSSSYTALNQNDAQVSLTRTGGSNLKRSSYDIGVLIEWMCPNSSAYVRAEYRFVGQGQNTPDVFFVSQTIVPR